MRYIPSTHGERRKMLDEIGVARMEDLFSAIPQELRAGEPPDLPPPLSEKDLLDCLGNLGRRNLSTAGNACFLGAGSYRHFIPSVVPALVSRGEFLTAYTPYQPEISQGTLQAMYEFQSYVCLLTGMEVSNASLYDGASAAAEALLMASRITGRHRFLVADSLHPEYRQVLETYTANLDITLETISFDRESGSLDAAALEAGCSEEAGGLVVQSPNFFGVVEDTAAIAEQVHRCGGLLISVFTEPFSLGILEAPGVLGADIVAGEGQSFGNPVSFGGPGLGVLATCRKHVRNMPGRIVGRTVDSEGESGFVLTLSTREQHIRRERATSNICSNQGLCALAATVFLSLLGKKGLAATAQQNFSKAHWLRERILSIPGYSPLFTGPFFNEFAVKVPGSADSICRRVAQAGVLGGLDLGKWHPSLKGGLLFCATENNTLEEMERLLQALEAK